MTSRHRAHEVPALPGRSRLHLTGLAAALLLAGAAPVEAQAPALRDTDRIDITGRQNLTLGSGARAYGMGGAFLARADDATAASWNPAGLSYLRAPEVTLVGTLNSFSTQRGFENDDFEGGSIDFAALTWPVGRGDVRGAIQVSYQRAISFDGRREIDIYRQPDAENPAQAELIETWRGSSDGGFDVVAFGTGLRLSRRLRAGLTVNRWTNGYDQSLDRTLLAADLGRPLRQFDLDFRPRGWSFNLGLIYSPIAPLNLGFVYKTPVGTDVVLDKTRRDYYGTLGALEEMTSNTYRSEAVTLDLPDSIGFGLSLQPRDELTLSADYTRTRWSDPTIAGYFDLPRTPRGEQDSPPPPDVRPPLLYPTLREPETVLAQEDAEQFRLGVEYVLFTSRLKVPLRLGYFSDRQITPNPTGELPRFNGITAGIGVVVGSLLFDVAYVYEFGEYFVTQESVPTDGAPAATAPTQLRYALTTNRVYASVVYRFSGRP
jgi:hypothetical protein